MDVIDIFTLANIMWGVEGGANRSATRDQCYKTLLSVIYGYSY
jgi:hypothetical protein